MTVTPASFPYNLAKIFDQVKIGGQCAPLEWGLGSVLIDYFFQSL